MLLVVFVVVAVLALGVAYQWIGARRDLRLYPPPGTSFAVDGPELHIRVAGAGRPPVVFEAGIAASSVSWRPLQDAVAQFTSTASYDRAGFAWSQASKQALTAPEMNETLRTLLTKAGLSPPYILVGHSFGALLVRLYAHRWPHEVAGLVLVDPALVREWAQPIPARLAMLRRGIALSRRGALLARVGFVRFCLTLLTGGLRFLPKLLSKLTSGRGHSVSERLVGEVRKLPPELWPAVQSHWCRPESFESMARHLEELPNAAALLCQTNPMRDIPVTVISAGNLTAAQREEHEAVAQMSSRGRHIVAANSGHWVHLDEPQIVVDAIRELLATDR